MDDWFTVAQAATSLEVSVQRVYALLAAGTLAGRKFGRVQLVSRRSVALYKDSPSRNKFAGGHLRKVGEEETPSLFDPEQGKLIYDGDEVAVLSAPLLSVEARRLYDADAAGGRFGYAEAVRARGEG